ncbi:hypothetical protein N9K05_03290 [Woeseiaceae bacterium]|nr:hypothetical protein [Woeseiaceae bacterium]
MKRFDPKSKYVKYQDSTWIECRKRVYLYWFKFLRIAEENADHKVQWNKYHAWGGKEAVMSMKFDAWWEKHWKDCFGIDKDKGTCKYPVNGRPKADGVRYALLCYENRHRGSNWDIAIHVQKREIKKRWGVLSFMDVEEDLNTKGNMKWGYERKRVVDEESRTGYRIALIDHTHQEYDDVVWNNQQKKRAVQSKVGRYLKQAMKHLESVSKGEF